MSDLKPTGTKIKLGEKEYGMRFTLNAIEDIQEHFGIPIQELGELLKDSKDSIKNIKFILTTLINEDIECLNDENGERIEKLDVRYVGRHIDITKIGDLRTAIFGSIQSGTPEAEDENPNAQSE